MRRRRFRIALSLVLTIGFAAWHWQSELIGLGARWYLQRIAARDGGGTGERRAVVERMHRLLLMPPPEEAMVGELFELVTALSTRVAAGSVSLNWAAYIYTGYVRDLIRDRPTGTPARTAPEVVAELDRTVAFYAIGKRPDVPGIRLSDLTGVGTDSYTVEEIDQAAREGRDLPLR
jgi:hypothetical protein